MKKLLSILTFSLITLFAVTGCSSDFDRDDFNNEVEKVSLKNENIDNITSSDSNEDVTESTSSNNTTTTEEINTKLNEKASSIVTENITTLTKKIADLDTYSQDKFQKVASKIQSELPDLLKELEANQSQKNVDKLTAKYIEYNKELLAIGNDNGIVLKSIDSINIDNKSNSNEPQVETALNEKAGSTVTSNMQTLTEKIADLDANSQAKFQEVATKVQSELTDLLKELDANPSQENIDKITAKYIEYNKELKDIGNANGIILKDIYE